MTMPPSRPQPKSRRILSHLLSELRSKLHQPLYKRYSIIINESQQLEELMYRCVRFDILAFIDDGKLHDGRDIKLDSRVNHDTSYDARAIYLHVIEKPIKQKWFYVGQSRKFQKRIVDHMNFRHREQEKSLHYYALQRSDHDYYIILSYVPDAETCSGLGIRGDRGNDSPLLDILEMWCCLMFQTLPEKYLKEFLPPDMPLKENKGLNLQLPLRNSDGPAANWSEIRNILAESLDPLHREFYSWQLLKFHHNKAEVHEHHKGCLEICKRLDGISKRSSTPSRPGLLSPPSTTSKPAPVRLESMASKQLWLSTPSIARSSIISSGESRGVTLADIEARNVNRTGHRKRKRDDDSFTEGEDLTRLPVNRKLFENSAKPKDNLH